jgi:hypothetical protein
METLCRILHYQVVLRRTSHSRACSMWRCSECQHSPQESELLQLHQAKHLGLLERSVVGGELGKVVHGHAILHPRHKSAPAVPAQPGSVNASSRQHYSGLMASTVCKLLQSMTQRYGSPAGQCQWLCCGCWLHPGHVHHTFHRNGAGNSSQLSQPVASCPGTHIHSRLAMVSTVPKAAVLCNGHRSHTEHGATPQAHLVFIASQHMALILAAAMSCRALSARMLSLTPRRCTSPSAFSFSMSATSTMSSCRSSCSMGGAFWLSATSFATTRVICFSRCSACAAVAQQRMLSQIWIAASSA